MNVTIKTKQERSLTFGDLDVLTFFVSKALDNILCCKISNDSLLNTLCLDSHKPFRASWGRNTGGLCVVPHGMISIEVTE